jgi:hypothetical protein
MWQIMFLDTLHDLAMAIYGHQLSILIQNEYNGCMSKYIGTS